MPTVETLPVRDACRLIPKPNGDGRGWFARYFCSAEFRHGSELCFVQFNQSFTRRAGTVRGLHLQIENGAEAKLVKCVRGRVLDVLVDVRRDSPTFMRHTAVELSAANRATVYVPPGVAHGFQTLEADVELIYHHTNIYMPEAERGIRFDDPRVGIAWPLSVVGVSHKDAHWPLLTADFAGFEIGKPEE